MRDAIAAARQVRHALAKSEARLRLALTAADVGTYEIDLDHGRAWVDRRGADLTGGELPAEVWIPIDDPRLLALFGRLPPDDRAMRRAALLAVSEGRTETVALTWRIRDTTGTWRWYSERGAVVAHRHDGKGPLRIVGVVRDVTEQFDRANALEREVAARTAALRESERRFRCVFESSFKLVGLLAPDGTLLSVNRAALEFLGGAEQDVIGRPIDAVGSWRDDPQAAERLRACVARAVAGAIERHEVSAADAGGRPRVFDFSLRPVRDDAGAVAMLVAEARDLTDWHGLQAQLAHAQKMEAVGQLAGGVAHDFNNLLQTLTGNLDLIHRHVEASGDPRLLQLTANAERAAARGARLAQRLLEFSRRRNARREHVWVGRLVADMTELLNRAAGETVQMETDPAADLWPCKADPAELESALLNLVLNARDAMPRGGTIRIAAANTEIDEQEAARLDVPAGAFIRIAVSDTGTGIAPEHLPQLFEPFFTTKPAGQGTGLGLAMVHGFARQSGGTVTVASVLGQGTVFTLFLPRATGRAGMSAEPPPHPEPPAPRPVPQPSPAGRRAILVVEDDAEVREAVQFALTDGGYRVLTAADAPAALGILADETRLDLLLSDVSLPGGASGLDIADAARQLRPALRVLLVSGFGEALDVPYEVLAKPFTQDALLRRVAEAWAPAAAD